MRHGKNFSGTSTKLVLLVREGSSDRDLPHELFSQAYIYAEVISLALVPPNLRSKSFVLFLSSSTRHSTASPLSLFLPVSTHSLSLSSETPLLHTLFNTCLQVLPQTALLRPSTLLSFRAKLFTTQFFFACSSKTRYS